MRIGFFIVATGGYNKYVTPLITSIQENIKILDAEFRFYVFTDHPKGIGKDTYSFYTPHLPWPLVTLLRYNVLSKYEETIRGHDYVFMIDADMLVTGQVTGEILGDRVGVRHPGFWCKKRSLFTYEDKTISTAFVSEKEGNNYFAGAFVGGKPDEFIRMCQEIAQMVETDLKNNHIALWHDESYVNRFFIDHPPMVILSPSYCHTEEYPLPFEKKISTLNKRLEND